MIWPLLKILFLYTVLLVFEMIKWLIRLVGRAENKAIIGTGSISPTRYVIRLPA